MIPAATGSFQVSGTHDWLFLLAALMFLLATGIAVVRFESRDLRIVTTLIGFGMFLAALARLFTT